MCCVSWMYLGMDENIMMANVGSLSIKILIDKDLDQADQWNHHLPLVRLGQLWQQE